MTVGPFDVPAFAAAGKLAGQEGVIISEVLSELEQIFAGLGVVFTTEKPAEGIEYSTVFVGGDDSAFAEYGEFLGLAEQVDIRNQDREDEGFVITDRFAWASDSPDKYTTSLSQTVLEEVAHLLGYAHDEPGGDAGPLSHVNNGTVTVEIYSAPSSVNVGQSVNIQVRIKLEGNTKSSPWQVESLAIRDDDIWPVYNTISSVSNPLTIYSQGTWYYHTFYNIVLSDWNDGGNGVELYAWGQVDDNQAWNGSPDDSSPIKVAYECRRM